jgi:hypothetical protein
MPLARGSRSNGEIRADRKHEVVLTQKYCGGMTAPLMDNFISKGKGGVFSKLPIAEDPYCSYESAR